MNRNLIPAPGLPANIGGGETPKPSRKWTTHGQDGESGSPRVIIEIWDENTAWRMLMAIQRDNGNVDEFRSAIETAWGRPNA